MFISSFSSFHLIQPFPLKVQPRNYLLLACHAFNEAAQLYQLRRGYLYEKSNRKAGESSPFSPLTFGATCAGLGAAGVVGPRFKVYFLFISSSKIYLHI